MNKKIRDVAMEPKKFFNDVRQVISLPKIIGFVLVIIFFVNMGIFIYDKKNPVDLDPFGVDKVVSPYSDKETLNSSPFGKTTSQSMQNVPKSDPDVEGVFLEKTKSTDNLPPIARAKLVTNSYTEGFFAGDTIFLSAMDSYDPDGSLQEHRWDFDQNNGLGIDAEGTTTTVKFNNAGVYTVTLLVIDNLGAESTTSLTVTVQEKPEETPNTILPVTTSLIDFEDLAFNSRLEIQNAVEGSFADFQANATSTLAQAIYNGTKKNLPALPSLSDIELSVGNDPSNIPPVVDSVNPKEGSSVFDLTPIISAGFYGNNEIDIDSIEMSVDGVPVTQDMMKTKFGVNYTPEKELGYGQHTVMLVIQDERGLKTVKSWNFTLTDPKAENDTLVPKYEDIEGPQIIMYYPDENAKDVKPKSDIRITYTEPVETSSVEVAVVDLSTNITKFFTGDQIQWNATKTGLVIRPNENIFDYDRSYQIVVRSKDELGNESNFQWYIMGEAYNAPEFVITSPTSNSSVNTPQITVTGSADPSHRITVDGQVAFVDGNGAFKADINLERGKNEILIVAKDLQGKESSQYLVVTYDPSANGGNPILDSQDSPVIMDASIEDGEVVKMVRPQISFVFADTDGIDTKSVLLKVDGKDVTTFAFMTADTITYKPLDPMTQGTHEVEIIIADKKGNTTDYKMNFTVDAYPDQPTNLTASLTNNNKSVLLLWNGVSNISNPEYRVFRSSNPNVATTASNEVKRGLTSTSWQDDTVIDGGTFYYVVTAVNDEGILSNPSNEVKIEVDGTAPLLQINSPKKNFISNENHIIIEGVTDKNDTTELTVSVNFVPVGNPVIKDDGTFEIDVPLVEGDNIITTVAKDSDGNETVDVRTVTYVVPDTIAPTVTKKSPMGTEASVDSNIVITYDEPMDATKFSMVLKPVDSTESVIPITILDIALQISEDKKTFTYNPPKDLLYVTTYSVEVKAYDLSGNESVGDDWEFATKDKTNPKLEVVTPVVNFISENEYIVVSGKTEPNINVSVSVNGNLQVPSITSQSNGYFNQQIRLDAGHNTVTVVATDHLNHSTMVAIEGTYDAPDLEKPLLEVNTPVQNAVINSANTYVKGYTEPKAQLTISVNGKDQGEVSVSGSGYFNHPVTLLSGVNLVRVISTDAAGNQSVILRTVTYDDQGPSLAVTNPINGFTTNVDRLEVRGITDRTDSQITIRVDGNTYTASVLPDGSFSKQVSLGRFNNNITVIAEDRNGNKTTSIVSVYYDPVGGSDGTLQGSSVNGSSVNGSSINESDYNNTNNIEKNSLTSKGDVSSLATNDTIDPSTGEQRWTGGDNKAPDLTVDSSVGDISADEDATIGGTTEPEAKVNVFHNGIYVYSGESDINNGGFAADTTLEEGKNVFIVTSTDASGNKTTRGTVVELDTKGPSLNILSPKINTIINTNKYYVYGVTEPNTKVSINVGNGGDTRVTSDESGYFGVNANVGADGSNQKLVVISTDEQGNETRKEIPIVIDKTKPSLTLTKIDNRNLNTSIYAEYPDGGLVTIASSNASISGRTEPNTTVKVFSDNRLLGTVTSSSNGNFNLSVGFASGEESKLRVVATDKGGNETNAYFRVHADAEAPVVEIFLPNGSRNMESGSVTVSGIVSDRSNPVSITLGLNSNLNVSSTSVSNFGGVFSLTLGGLKEGPNTIHVKAVDDLGNTTRKQISIMYSSRHDDPLTSIVNNASGGDTTYNDLGEAVQPAEDYMGVFPDTPQADPVSLGYTKTIPMMANELITGQYWNAIKNTLRGKIEMQVITNPLSFLETIKGWVLGSDGDTGGTDQNIIGPFYQSVSLTKTYSSSDSIPENIVFDPNSYSISFSSSVSSASDLYCDIYSAYGITHAGITGVTGSGGSYSVSLHKPSGSTTIPSVSKSSTGAVDEDGNITVTYEGEYSVQCYEN